MASMRKKLTYEKNINIILHPSVTEKQAFSGKSQLNKSSK